MGVCCDISEKTVVTLFIVGTVIRYYVLLMLIFGTIIRYYVLLMLDSPNLSNYGHFFIHVLVVIAQRRIGLLYSYLCC